MNISQRISNYVSDRIVYPITKLLFFRKFRFKDTSATLEYILEKKCSVSRYGDGELDVIYGGSRGFQNYDGKLAIRLKEILKSDLPGHIVCMPYSLKSTRELRGYAHYFWKDYFEQHYRQLNQVLSPEKVYYDSLITRFYMDYKDKSKCAAILTLLKKIWEQRNVILVEGNRTCSGIGNDLYNNAKSLKRIICPAENAFDKYDEILKIIKEKSAIGDLILLSLGMTATVLAYDLAQAGFQAIDLGHIDIEYEWFLQKADKKIALKNRYVNEVKGGNIVEECNDPIYRSQIMAKII